MPSLTSIFEIIATDEKLAQGLFSQLDDLKDREKGKIMDIIYRYLTAKMVDDDGYIKPGALTDKQLQAFEDDLTGYFDYDNLDPFLNDCLDTFDTRLKTIDTMMSDLGLTDGILGEAVFELPVVVDEIDKVGNAMVEARNGNGEDWDGALQNIRQSFADYRYDRKKGRKTKLLDLQETLRKDAQVLPNYTNSIASTSLARMDRTLRRTQSLSAGLEYGKYVGPLDDITRPFCREQLDDPIKKWETWDSMENNMTIPIYKSPVSKVGGGINCRHRIIPWDLAWSKGKSSAEIRAMMRAAFKKVA